jgi:hypothetical protein
MLPPRKFYFVFFRDAVLGQFSRHLPLIGSLALVAAVLFLNLGGAYGVPLLFWHEVHWQALLAGSAVILLVGKIFFTGFLLDAERPGDSERRWVAMLDPAVASDDLRQLGYYLVGCTVSLAAALLVGLVVWAIGLAISHLQLNGQGTTAQSPGSAANRPPVLAYVFFSVGALVGAAIIYSVWALFSRLLKPLEDTEVSRFLEKTLFLGDLDKPNQKRLHILARSVTVLLAITYVFSMIFMPDGLGTAATALCTLLGLIVAIYGYLMFRSVNPIVIVIAIVALLFLGGIPEYKLRVKSLDPYYADGKLAKLAGYDKSPASAGIKTDPSWLSDGKKRPLVIVCVSGGGIRAAVWAAAVMHRLEAIPDFPYHVRIISGASGGMVGMSYYTATLQDPAKHLQTGRYHDVDTSDDNVAETLAKDSLSRTTKQMIYRDVPALILPLPSPTNRGETLERQWQENWGKHGSTTFGDLRPGEEAGWRPSLIFSPMLVEDGRRLLISNLNLGYMTANYGHRLNNPDGPFLSQSGYEFSRLFPAAMATFPLRTAARLNASFPYVTPAPELPTLPRRRVADAGYYDNYGVSVAGTWLTEYLSSTKKCQWLHDNVSGVIVVQIRDGVSELDDKDAALEDAEGSPGGRSVEFVTSPITGMMSARDSVTRFRNDNQLERLGQMFNEAKFPKGYFTTATFEFGGQASLSWYLTEQERTSLLSAAAALDQSAQMSNLKSWWAGTAAKESSTTEPVFK